MLLAKEGNKKREPYNVMALYILGKVIYIHRQNMVPYQWPQWLVVDAIGAQLRAFGNSTD